MEEKKTSVIHIKCPPTLKNRLRVKCAHDHRSLSDAIRLLLLLYVNGGVSINE